MLFSAKHDLAAHLNKSSAHWLRSTGLEKQECRGIFLGVLQIYLNTQGSVNNSIICIIFVLGT